jgi:hypothetical protein
MPTTSFTCVGARDDEGDAAGMGFLPWWVSLWEKSDGKSDGNAGGVETAVDMQAEGAMRR